MQLMDTAAAFSLKKHVDAVKGQVRREKRGDADWDAVFLKSRKNEMRCSNKDLLRICNDSWKRLVLADTVEDPARLLRAARSAGWLSYRGDPRTKALVRCDTEA